MKYTKIVKYGASWCGPCRAQHNEILKLEDEHIDGLEIVEKDVDEVDESELDKYSIKSVPTLVFIAEDGSYITKSNLMTCAQLKNELGL